MKTIIESILDKIKKDVTNEHLELSAWRKVADSRVGGLISANKENCTEAKWK